MFVVGRRLASVAAATAATAASLACASENEGLTPTLKQIAEERRQSMPERIILVRHGESEANADHTLWRTKADNALVLTDKGHAQARKAGERIRLLTGDAPVGFFCSPFARTIQTMRGIQAAWGERKANVRARSQGGTNWVSIEPQIREQEFGNLQGDEHRLYREEQKKVGRFFYRFPTGESGADVYDRTKTWMRNDLLTVNTGVDGAPVDNVVVVTHGLTMRLILMNVLQASPRPLPTASPRSTADGASCCRRARKPLRRSGIPITATCGCSRRTCR